MEKNKDKQLYDTGCMGILAGGYSGITLFLNSLYIGEMVLGILGISLGVLLILQWKEAYNHRKKYIMYLKYLLIAEYAVFILVFINNYQPVQIKILALAIAFLLNSIVLFIIFKVGKRFT